MAARDGKSKARDKARRAPKNGGLERLLAENRAGAEKVEEGHFRLDWTRALDKVKRFQLTDPHRYVLELAQCAVAAGATYIDVYTDSDDVIVSYDAPVHTRDELQQLFDYLFAQARELFAAKQLALAVNSALALEPKFIIVDSGDGQTSHRLRLSSHDDVAIETLASDDAIRGTRVHVRDRMSWSVLIDLFRARTVEGKHLAENCSLAPIPVRLNGQDLVQELQPAALARRQFTTGKGTRQIRGMVALPDKARESAEVHILMNGVRVVSHEMPDPRWLGPIGYVAYVDAPLLTRNASHSDVQRDREFDRAMRAVRDAVRGMMRAWLEQLLCGPDQSWREQAGALSDIERHYVEMAARTMLRSGASRIARSLDALLDVPDMVELAVRRPRLSPLRPIWESVRDHDACHVATRRYDISLSDLGPGVVPVLASSWAPDTLFSGRTRNADDLLADVEAGLKNRREREAMRREAVLEASEAMVKVAVEHEQHQIRGEFGLQRPNQSAGRTAKGWLLGQLSSDEQETGSMYRVRVLFLQDGVPLGERVLDSKVAYGVAVLDSPNFTPTPYWDDLSPNAASNAVKRLLEQAVPQLLHALCEDFAHLPPPRGMRDTGWFSVEGGSRRLPGQLLALWPSDSLAQDARWHVDTILERGPKLTRDRAPWLYTWPIFHVLDGDPVSMAHVVGERPAPGYDGTDRPSDEAITWRYAVEVPWGPGTPASTRIINVSSTQRDILLRYLGGRIKDGAPPLERARMAMEREYQRAEQRRRNLASARARRQAKAELDARYYAVVVDLDIDGGEGQAGIPAYGGSPGYIRVLVDDLPLCDHPLDAEIPVHAIVRCDKLEPDDVFEAPRSPTVMAAVEGRVRRSFDALVAALAESREATTQRGQEIVWGYLGGRKPPSAGARPTLPKAVLDLPFLPTVDRGLISLQVVREDADKHGGSVLVAARSLGRQLQERLILVLNGEQQNVLRRVLAVRLRDYTRELQNEEDVLARIARPRSEPVLQQPVSLRVDVDQDGVRGQIAIAQLMTSHAGGQYSHWLDLHKNGVPIERVPWDFLGAPFVGVLDCKDLRTNKTWDSVLRDSIYKKVMRIAQGAAESLILGACSQFEGSLFLGHDAASVAECLRGIASRQFPGTPDLDRLVSDDRDESEHESNASALDRALAGAPIWPSADIARAGHSLLELSQHWRRTGVVWVTSKGRGHLSPGRVMVHGDETMVGYLRQIFGDRVRDGSKVLRRDDLAHQRRVNAPAMHTNIAASVASESVSVERELADVDLRIRGEVALWAAYGDAKPGLHMVVGIDGKRLCERTIAHPLRGLALIDCAGLRPNRDWDGMADDRQVRCLDDAASEALWQACREAAERAGSLQQQLPADAHLRIAFLHALAALCTDTDDPALMRNLSEAPLFYTVTGQAMSLADIRAYSQERCHVLVVSDQLGCGQPEDGRIIVRAGEAGQAVLEASLGRLIRRHDQEWEKELEGQERRRQTPRVEPHLEGDIAFQYFVQKDSTSALIGLVRPSSRKHFDDSSDGDSRVHLHIDHRRVTHCSLIFHPTVEVWLDDDRLTPSPDFRNIVQDEHYRAAISVVRSAMPEVLARAAEVCNHEPNQMLRRRLCHYVLDHRKTLVASARKCNDGPEARFLRAPMWRCLTSAGGELAATEQLLAAQQAGILALVDEDARGSAVAENVLAVRVSRFERALLCKHFGELRDVTDDLRLMEARRRFMARAPAAGIRLEATGTDAPLVWRHTLKQPGWEGELGVCAHPGVGIETRVFLEHRPLCTLEIAAPIRALCAARWQELEPTADYDDLASGTAKQTFIAGIERALLDALIELGRALPELRPSDREPAERVLLVALGAYSQLEADRGKKARNLSREHLLTVLADVPLLPDTTERMWSVAALKAAHAGREIATISPDTAKVGMGTEERVVLVLDDERFQIAGRLLRVARYDQRYLESIAARQRMERAPTEYKLPRNAICRDAVRLGPLSGELALAESPEDGRVGLLANGRLVEARSFFEFSGLVGYLDGDLPVDRAFTRVELEHDHMRALKTLYDQRLERAVADAAAYKGRRSSSTWRALRGYVMVYLHAHADELGKALAERREHVLSGRASFSAGVADALRCPIFELEGGDFVDVATLLSSPRPVVVRAPEVKKQRNREPATSLVGDNRDIALLTALLGSKVLFTYQEWLASEERLAEQNRAQAEERAALREAHTLARLKSVLREAAAGTSSGRESLARISLMSVVARGKGVLAEREQETATILINRDHPLWRTVSSRLEHEPTAILHLAAAIVTELGLRRNAFDRSDALVLFTALAEYAAEQCAPALPSPG